MRSLIKPVWSNYRPADRMWPATPFPVARGSIQEKPSNLKFVEKGVSYICLTELLALDKVHLHMNNE